MIAKPLFHELEIPDSVNKYEGEKGSSLYFTQSHYKAKHSIFRRITFDGWVCFLDVNLSIGLVFENCNFDGAVIFNNIKASGFHSDLNPKSENIVFKNCTFNKSVEFSGENSVIERSILFEDSTFLDGLEINGLKIEMGGLNIRNCTVHRKMDLFSIIAKQDVSLNGNTVNCFIRVTNLNCDTLTILGDNKVNGNFHIRDSFITRGIVFNNGVFKKEVFIDLVNSVKPGLTIIGSAFEQSVGVNYHKGKVQPGKGLHSFYFADSKFNNGIYINGTENIFSENPIVEEITINISSELKGDIVFRNLHVGILNMTGYNTSANIFMEHLYINQIKIKALINNAGLILSMISASYLEWYDEKEIPSLRSNALYIDDSNFGKAQFFQVDFSSFEKIVFHNNILIDISTSLVKWFTREQLEQGMEISRVRIYREARKSKNKQRILGAAASMVSLYRSKQEIYRQLKLSSQKQADIPQSLEFQKHEMHYYRKIVDFKKPKNWSEYLILWSNQSNDFGQSWLKALGLLLVFSFISYLPIGFLTSGELDYSKFATSASDVLTNLKVVFYSNLKIWTVLLNPAHRISDINRDIDNFSSWVYVWDLLSRIVVSYFLFQMISAFRKFSKG